ncbi:MAG: hypothetical protein VSS52_005725, partial [Thiotrichaceae bacterium]|nr:hypothetical protein [Thiotrichaceae bacterium]
KDAEIQRLTKEMDKIRKDLDKCQAKLNNPKFTARAPEKIVNVEKQRVADFTSALQQLDAQLEKIKGI